MIILGWEKLPPYMQKEQLKPYYNLIRTKKTSVVGKRIIDLVLSVLMLIIAIPLFVVLFLIIKIDSKGPAFFLQERVTQYGKRFMMVKFRTMVANSEALGSQITMQNDARVTKVGKVIRKYRLDELPQLLNIISGDMSFVGTRPEVPKYVAHYTDEMYATLLMPAGVTSKASIKFKDEDKLLGEGQDTDTLYIEKVLPAKMSYNLESLHEFSLIGDIQLMFQTVLAVFDKNPVPVTSEKEHVTK